MVSRRPFWLGPLLQGTPWRVTWQQHHLFRLNGSKNESKALRLRSTARNVSGYIASWQHIEKDAYRSVLAWILIGWESERARRRERRHREWYWRERERIEDLLEEISEHDLVRSGPDIESVLFYEPHQVDCPHGRRTKRCVEIRDKLELLQLLGQTPAGKHFRQLKVSTPLLNGLERRVQELQAQLQEEGIDPSRHRPEDFCTPILGEPIDQRARAEVGGASWRPAGWPGAPTRDLQNFLLETAAERLYDAGASRRQACKLLARVLIYCFDLRRPRTEKQTEDAEENVPEALERQWRALRAEGRRPGPPRMPR